MEEPQKILFSRHIREPLRRLWVKHHPTDILRKSYRQVDLGQSSNQNWKEVETRLNLEDALVSLRFCIFCICFHVSPFPTQFWLYWQGVGKGEGPDETFGDKLLVGHSQTFISYKESMEILRRWHLHFSISQRNMEIYVVGVCKI